MDLKPPEFASTEADEFELLDLRDPQNCLKATNWVNEVYALAADTGGVGFAPRDPAEVSRGNSLIDSHCIEAAKQNRVGRFLYVSTTGVYPQLKISTAGVPLASEKDEAHHRKFSKDGGSFSVNDFANSIDRTMVFRHALFACTASTVQCALGLGA